MNCTAVLLEAVSIQNYVFQSNKLKTNMGASHIIGRKIFGPVLEKAVSDIFEQSFDFQAWRENPDDIRIVREPFEIGYVGGGNVLLLFQEESKAKDFLRLWSRELMTSAPGVVTAAVVGEFDLDAYDVSMLLLFEQLRFNKTRYIPQTAILRHGITAECPHTGLSAEAWETSEKVHISSVAMTKILEAENARDHFQMAFSEELKNQYCFTNDFEKIGSISGEDSHIAVVHIDGNRMATRFRGVESLHEMRNLSLSVEKATSDAFSEMVRTVVDQYDELMADLGFDNMKKDSRYQYPMDKDYQKKVLPLTPIVLGGDDVTFVCDGKLGVYLARLFISLFQKKTVSDGKPLTACAGVAVIKTKYPFYRGYQMAEELCDSAKKMNENEENPEKLISALDFQISMGGISSSLESLREKQYHVPQGNLLYRPYMLTQGKRSGNDKNLDVLLNGAAQLLKSFPNNKIKELRRVLSLSKESCIGFVEEMKYRGRHLPAFPGKNFHETLFENSETIYFDMIEFSKFFPKSRLGRGAQNEVV